MRLGEQSLLNIYLKKINILYMLVHYVEIVALAHGNCTLNWDTQLIADMQVPGVNYY